MANDPTDLTEYPIPSTSFNVAQYNAKVFDGVMTGDDDEVSNRAGVMIKSVKVLNEIFNEAEVSATAAAVSETNAAASETAAASSAGAASTSETNAASSAGAAATSETNAATSETNAATSETNSAVSETNAAASESAAEEAAAIAVNAGVTAYVASQLANGASADVVVIEAGVDVSAYDYFIYQPDMGAPDGRLFINDQSRTGTFAGDFNPVTGIDSGLTGALTQIEAITEGRVVGIESQLNKSVTITMTDATYSLSSAEQLYGRIVIGGTLTAEQELVVGSSERFLKVKNNTAFAVKAVCVASGSGIHIPSGATFDLRINDTSEVETNGNANEIIINELKGDGSTITYPFGLSETDFYRMRSNGYRTGSTEIRRGLTMINFKDIEDYPTNWVMSSNTSSTGTNVNYDITRASSTTASVSATSAGVATMVYELKDGISY